MKFKALSLAVLMMTVGCGRSDDESMTQATKLDIAVTYYDYSAGIQDIAASLEISGVKSDASGHTLQKPVVRVGDKTLHIRGDDPALLPVYDAICAKFDAKFPKATEAKSFGLIEARLLGISKEQIVGDVAADGTLKVYTLTSVPADAIKTLSCGVGRGSIEF